MYKECPQMMIVVTFGANLPCRFLGEDLCKSKRTRDYVCVDKGIEINGEEALVDSIHQANLSKDR